MTWVVPGGEVDGVFVQATDARRVVDRRQNLPIAQTPSADNHRLNR